MDLEDIERWYQEKKEKITEKYKKKMQKEEDKLQKKLAKDPENKEYVKSIHEDRDKIHVRLKKSYEASLKNLQARYVKKSSKKIDSNLKKHFLKHRIDMIRRKLPKLKSKK